MKKLALTLLFSVVLNAEPPAKRLSRAAVVLGEVMSSSDQSIPLDLIRHAECVAVIPGMLQGALAFGGKYGKGFFSCRKGADWSAPAAVRIEGGSFGFQIGGMTTDIVMLVMNRQGADRLLRAKFTIGGEGEVAMGQGGRSASAQTDLSLHAEILSWSRSHGVFAGVSLQGATLRQDLGDNGEIYGKRLTTEEIIKGQTTWPTEGADLRAALRKYATRPPDRRLPRKTNTRSARKS